MIFSVYGVCFSDHEKCATLIHLLSKEMNIKCADSCQQIHPTFPRFFFIKSTLLPIDYI